MSTVTNVLRDPLGDIPIPVGIQDGLNRWAGHQGFLALLTFYVAIALPLLYFVGLATYRLTLSPLANIPGNKLAALTYWYEIYYDVWLGGQYFRKVEEMHHKYGPIVRISPHEVHFNDPDFIDTLFPGPSRKTNKHFFTGRRTGTQNSMVATVDHDLHRKRRNTVNAYFSSASIRRLEPGMKEDTAKLLSRMEAAGAGEGQVLQMHHVLKAYTADVITQYAFGDSFHFLNEEDYAAGYMEATDVYHMLNHTFCHFPWVSTLMATAPPWALNKCLPILNEMWSKQALWMEKVKEIRNSPNPERVKSTIFEGILNSKLPDEEKSDARLAHEAQLIVLAGQGTTAYTLMAALYELLAHPTELQKVKAELSAAIPTPGDVPSFSQVETLPYLGATVQEVLRLHPGVVSRLPRVSPDLPVVYRGGGGREYVIPPGTPYSMTVPIAHMNADVFEEPYEFRPQRWIDNPRLDRAVIGFARGTRNCIGMTFARQQMFIALAAILRKYDLYRGQEGPTLELYDTIRERDIDLNREFIIPFPAKGSHGLRVRVRS